MRVDCAHGILLSCAASNEWKASLVNEPVENPQSAPLPGLPDILLTWPDPHRHARRALLRRLRLLLAGGLAFFTLLLWGLVRVEDPLALLGWGSGPRRVVHAHLDALRRGESRAAYEYFSQHYREEIPWPAYERMVSAHSEMFRTRLLEVSDQPSDHLHAVLDARLLSANGRYYLARFTVVRIADRWWIDSIRWSQAPDPARFSRT
jgi:hypothetical protein